jgi:hypothetical protein
VGRPDLQLCHQDRKRSQHRQGGQERPSIPPHPRASPQLEVKSIQAVGCPLSKMPETKIPKRECESSGDPVAAATLRYV